MFKLFFVRFRRRDSCQNSIESWLQAQIWLHESALWFIFNSVNVKSISWVVCFCSSSLSDWSSNSQTLKCKTQLSDNPVAVVSSCTGTQKKETLTNCVITPCMVMKAKEFPRVPVHQDSPPVAIVYGRLRAVYLPSALFWTPYKFFSSFRLAVVINYFGFVSNFSQPDH